MWAIAVHVVAGVVGFLFKLGLDIRAEHQARKAVAAALAGELGAYLRLFRPEQTLPKIKHLTKIPYEARKDLLRGLFSPPSGNPVFDRVADKIGGLSPEAARGISEAYNIITGGRLQLAAMSSEPFVQLSDQMQIARITGAVDSFEREIEGMQKTVAMLDRLSRQSVRCYLFGCG